MVTPNNKTPVLTLRKKLFDDLSELSKILIDIDDPKEKVAYKLAYDLIESYIEICEKRNRY